MAGDGRGQDRAQRIRLVAGRASVEVAPGVGGRVAALEVDGWDLVRRDGWTAREWGVFVMAPWAGRLRDARVAWDGRTWSVPETEPPHALHGTVLDKPWTETAREDRRLRLEATFGRAWKPGGRLVHELVLDETRLRLTLTVHAGSAATPAIVGWHPWFRRRAISGESVESGDVEVVVDAGRRLEMDPSGLPTGRLLAPRRPALDDVLLDLARDPVVGWPGGPSLTLRCAEAAAWVVYAAHPDGVCVEPLTGAPDGLNGGPLGPPPVARPGSPLVATFEIAWG